MTHPDSPPEDGYDLDVDDGHIPSQDASRMMRAVVAAQNVGWDATQRFLEQPGGPRTRRRRGRGSVVFALRLDPRELEALERRAYAIGNKPSVVARNLIRVGLARPADLTLARLANEAANLATRLREAASGPAPPGR